MKRGKLLISDELLRNVLAIPDDVHVVGVFFDETSSQWSMLLTGNGLPAGCDVPESDAAPLLNPTYYKDTAANIVSFVRWS
jgi:hypothetical protein